MSTSGSASSPEPGGGQAPGSGAAAYGGYGQPATAVSQQHSAYASLSRRSSSQSHQFSTTMRDRQARGKDPYEDDGLRVWERRISLGTPKPGIGDASAKSGRV
ncbi:hypothetical protein MKZ38_001067 [Zalerion maritima]|uniref:Uncharacterized protein n=1 Tax=Zalerion maritima TaxID=339359 RepID=A0AAD5RG11_9PEZI|nr:hypothetical protein MKZ38_001067 [Zalerion maritima]